MKTLFLSIVVAILLQSACQSAVLTFKMDGCDFKWSESNVTVTRTFTTKKAKLNELLFGISPTQLEFCFTGDTASLFIEKGKQIVPQPGIKKTICGKIVYVWKGKLDIIPPQSYFTYVYVGVKKNFRVYQDGPGNGKIPAEFSSVIKSIKVVKSK